MAIQNRNDELVDILGADFVRNQPQGFWHAHRTNMPTGVTLEIPAEHQMLIAKRFAVKGRLEIKGEMVVI